MTQSTRINWCISLCPWKHKQLMQHNIITIWKGFWYFAVDINNVQKEEKAMRLKNSTTWQFLLESSARFNTDEEGQARPTPQNLSLILSPFATKINHSREAVLLPFLGVGVEDVGALPSIHRLVRRHFAFCSQRQSRDRVSCDAAAALKEEHR